MVERISTNLMYNLLTRNIAGNQEQIFNLSKKLSSGTKFITPYDNPVGIIGATQTQGRIRENDQQVRDRNTMISDLQAQEAAIESMINLIGKVHEIAVQAGNETIGAEERNAYNLELRSIGENILQLVNSKSGEKYVFSGEQSNIKTIRLAPGAAFNQAVYKNNQDNGKERKINGVETSISLANALMGGVGPAILSNKVINPVATATGNMDFEVNDGNGNLITFSVAVTTGDDLTTLITKINTAFTGAGGGGSIAQENPTGYLEMNSSLITGNSQNSSARISVLSTSSTAVTNPLGINKQDNFGREIGLMNSLTTFENALSTNNPAAIRNLLDDLQFNLEEFNAARTQVGLRMGQAEDFNRISEDLNLKYQQDLSLQQDLDMVEATMQWSNLQAALQTSIQTSASFFSQNIANFIG